MTKPRLTIAIAARDAESTIARAAASCGSEGACRFLLVDDHCVDRTVAIARSIIGTRLRVVSAPDPGGVAAARGRGLEAIDTEFAAWLDADDEWVPGRAARLMAMLDRGCDVAVDSFDLHDGGTGARLRRLSPPTFLRAPRGAVRLFERNWLPGDTPVGFRVSMFRAAGGYDPEIVGPESYDLLLRAIALGARFSWSDTVGYRVFAYPNSVSRQIERQRGAVAAALRKHSDEQVRSLYVAAGYSERIAAWALVSVALFRNDAGAALRHLRDACPDGADPFELLEVGGPWPFPEGWRQTFTRGVCLLLDTRDSSAAVAALEAAESILPTPEGLNNLGVAWWRAGHGAEAREAFAEAIRRLPGYLDATLNLQRAIPNRVTTHPLRHAAARQDYALANAS